MSLQVEAEAGMHIQTLRSPKPCNNNNSLWSSKLDDVLQDYGRLSLSTPPFMEPD